MMAKSVYLKQVRSLAKNILSEIFLDPELDCYAGISKAALIQLMAQVRHSLYLLYRPVETNNTL